MTLEMANFGTTRLRAILATMQFSSLSDLKKNGEVALATGPIALIIVEDKVEVDTTLRHHINAGFKSVIAFLPASFKLPDDVEAKCHRVDFDAKLTRLPITEIVNDLIPLTHGEWLYYCYNAEFLFHPFCETRNVAELLSFHAEERREAMLTYVIDVYASDVQKNRNGVSIEDAFMDRTGYYALARSDPEQHNHPKERQLDFFGGLHWRFEEHIPVARRKIDRVSLFLSKPGLEMRPGYVFSDEEYNTFACPWHNNLTSAIVSFRASKALKRNPGSSFDIHNFKWHNSVQFEWHSRQLMDLGLMEPGQWF